MKLTNNSFKNKVNKMLRFAKNTYYINCFNNSMHDIRKS